MALLTDAAYGIAAAATLPIWATRLAMTGKWRTDWSGRFGHAAPWPRSSRPRILIHTVSVGETAAIRHLVAALESAQSSPEIVISATTDTGIDRARSLYAERHRIARYPFDFSRCVRRFLDALQPDLAVLAELEVWPNFVAECRRRAIPLAVVNGRVSDRSIARYAVLKPILARSFRAISLVAAQTEEYAQRFESLGVPRERIRCVGTMKWDTAEIADHVPGADTLRTELGIDPSRPLIVAGSTAPGEEALLRRSLPRGAQLLCVPRKPEWFDAAARALPGCTRRSTGGAGSAASATAQNLFLLDSMGELRKAYALADLVVVGRTFAIGRRDGGSDMMEPVGLGKATIVGPDVTNFRDTANRLLAAGGVLQCDGSALARELERLLRDPATMRSLADRGREVIRAEQGASRRTAELLCDLLPAVRPTASSEATRSVMQERVRA